MYANRSHVRVITDLALLWALVLMAVPDVIQWVGLY